MTRVNLRSYWPLGQTLLLAGAILPGCWLGAELLTRSTWLRPYLPVPSRGGVYKYLDIKYASLQAFAEHNSVDCVLIGSSLVGMGIDPALVQQGYRSQTNANLSCFNLGLDAVVADHLGEVAQIAVDEYHPHVVVYGLMARDFSAVSGRGNFINMNDVAASDWARYRLGHFSWQGWFIDNSTAYRYYLGYLRSINPEDQSLAYYISDLQPDGYGGKSGVSPDFINAGPVTPASYGNIFINFKLSPESLQGLRQLMALRQRGVEVVLVEMPFNPRFSAAFEHGLADNDWFEDQIAQESQKQGAPFWPTAIQPNIPSDGWYNFTHLNTVGAAILSRWLGQQLGQLSLVSAKQP